MDQPTRVLNALIALGDNPDHIALDEQAGQAFIDLGNGLSIALGLSSQAALDKLATVTARAAAEHRARNLQEVA